jgi:hypothetical protein
MKTTFFSILFVFSIAPAWAETSCKAIEYPDRTEAICIGDEKAALEQNTSPPIQRSTSNAPLQDRTSLATPTKAIAEAKTPSVLTPTLSKSETTVTRHTQETAAEHLARRKALAERTSNNLSGRATPGNQP